MSRRLRMYRDIVRILLQRIRIWLTSIKNTQISKYTILHFRVSRIELAILQLFDSLILAFAISIFNFVTSQFLIYQFRLSIFPLSAFPVLTFNVASSKHPIPNFSNFHRNKSLACKQITTER